MSFICKGVKHYLSAFVMLRDVFVTAALLLNHGATLELIIKPFIPSQTVRWRCRDVDCGLL